MKYHKKLTQIYVIYVHLQIYYNNQLVKIQIPYALYKNETGAHGLAAKTSVRGLGFHTVVLTFESQLCS